MGGQNGSEAVRSRHVWSLCSISRWFSRRVIWWIRASASRMVWAAAWWPLVRSWNAPFAPWLVRRARLLGAQAHASVPRQPWYALG